MELHTAMMLYARADEVGAKRTSRRVYEYAAQHVGSFTHSLV